MYLTLLEAGQRLLVFFWLGGVAVSVNRTTSRVSLGGTFSSMIMACINPHRLCFTGALKPALAIKIESASISDKHVLMKSLVPQHKPPHELGANAAALITWKHEHVRVIDDQVPVRNGVAKPD